MNTFSLGFVLLYEHPLHEEAFTVLNCGIKTDAADGE
jgi:hypothetical protein